MTLEDLVIKFRKHPAYLEKGNPSIAKMFHTTTELVIEAKRIAKTTSISHTTETTVQEEKVTSYIPIGTEITKENIHDLLNIKREDFEITNLWVKTANQKLELSAFLKSSFVKEITEDLADIIKNLDLSVQPFPISNFPSNRSLFVYMSDKHIGADTKGSFLGNEYNAEEFNNRMERTLEEIFYISSTFGKFDKIVIFDMGDALDGFDAQTVRGGHSLPQNMSNREVYKTFIESHVSFFSKLQQTRFANSIEFRTIGESNHGGDFEWICYKSLEAILNATMPEITTSIGDKFIEHFVYGEHAIIITHGKDMKDMKHGFPKNLDDKTEKYFKSYIDYHGLGDKVVTVVKGDLHTSNFQQGSFFRYKNVLSMFGSSKWMHTNFAANLSGVDFEIVYEDAKRIIPYQLIFDTK